MNHLVSPKVAVVMATYNRAHLIEAVIRSILDQDYSSLELIIVDDGSEDGTASIIQSLSAQDSRLRCIHLSGNRGVGYARDAGIQSIRHGTEYVALADSDDLWLQGRLRKQLDILDRYPDIDVLFGDFDNVDHVTNTRQGGFAGGRAGTVCLQLIELESHLFFVESGLELGILRSNFIATATMILRKDVFHNVGGFDASLNSPELEFCWRAAVMGVRFAFLDYYLIERHRYSDGLTADGDKPWLHRLVAIDAMYQTCRALNRTELIPSVQETERRSYSNLLLLYSKERQIKKATRIYVKSLRCGFSVRMMAMFVSGLMGPNTIARLHRLRKWLSHA